jgi:hypothetical protein
METKKKTADELHDALECFVGTFAYHTHKIGDLKLLLTDGCDYIRREAESYWLFDSILAYQMDKTVRGLYHQVWRLMKQSDDTWQLTSEDGNNNLIVAQKIQFSDFPLPEITIWIIDGVAMLPSEY